jgi:hypothetical protein
MEFQNGVHMRKDKNKVGPSGCSRNDAFSLPESWGGRNCLLPISNLAVIRELKEELDGDSILDFVDADFGRQAEGAYDHLGITKLNMDNVWVIFTDMLMLLSESA